MKIWMMTAMSPKIASLKPRSLVVSVVKHGRKISSVAGRHRSSEKFHGSQQNTRRQATHGKTGKLPLPTADLFFGIMKNLLAISNSTGKIIAVRSWSEKMNGGQYWGSTFRIHTYPRLGLRGELLFTLCFNCLQWAFTRFELYCIEGKMFLKRQ